MASGRITKDLHTFRTSKYFQPTQSQNFEYSGISVTIPPHCVFSITAQSVFNNTPPDGVLISSSNTSANKWDTLAINEDRSSYCTVSGYNVLDSARTYYVWIKGSGNNDAQIYGFYKYVD